MSINADDVLGLFRSEDDWAVFIEMVCFRPGQGGLRQLLEEGWRTGETPRVAEMALLWQTRQWRHLTLGDTERPRSLPYFQALARATATSDVTELHQQDPATFSTDWRIYDAEERAEEDAARAGREAQEQTIRQQPLEAQEQLRAMGGWFVFGTQRDDAQGEGAGD